MDLPSLTSAGASSAYLLVKDPHLGSLQGEALPDSAVMAFVRRVRWVDGVPSGLDDDGFGGSERSIRLARFR